MSWSFCLLASLLVAVGPAVSAAEPAPPPAAPKKEAAEPYPGFAADQVLLRKHFVHPARDGAKPVKASSGEACQAAMRVFSKMSFLFRTREEVLKLLGDPATINDYNQPAAQDPQAPLVYRFDSGFGGLKYTLGFEQGQVFRVEVESQN